MSKLLLYTVFHGNLNYSYIPEDLYPQILRRCYWPLLRMIDELDVPLGLEFSAYSLQAVNRLDPSFVQELGRLWRQGSCEFIGSGYVQSIMPLIPSQANRKNLALGNEVYQELLGACPKVAYVNELVFSAGLPQLYHEAGYESLIVNSDSSLPVHDQPQLLYRPCAVSFGDGQQMPVIWHSLKVYRDFQQYVEDEISLDTYLARLLSHMPETGERAVPFYSSDWEVFDFKPWRVYPEGFRQPDWGEMDRIAGLLELLKRRDDMEFMTPSSVVSRFPDPPVIHPESGAYPLTYKKQDQHAVARWAVGGRDSVRLNTQCHQLYQELLLADWFRQNRNDAHPNQESSELWKELCFLWSSDFRTFTTEEKYLEFRNRMGAALARVKDLTNTLLPATTDHGKVWLANSTSVPSTTEPIGFSMHTNGASHSGLPAYELEFGGQAVPCQVTVQDAGEGGSRRLTLEASPVIAAAGSGFGTIQQRTSSVSAHCPDWHIDAKQHIVETPTVRLKLQPQLGGGIESLAFPEICDDALALQPNLGNDADRIVLGDLTLADSSGRWITDHQEVELEYPDLSQRHEIFVPVRCYAQTEMGTVWKTYRVYLDQPRVDLVVRFQWRDVVPKSFRLGRVALNPKAFDRGSLFYATTNGGDEVERYLLARERIFQDGPVGTNSSASCCLGATEGWTVLGDATKGVGLVTRPSGLYSVPLLHYEETEGDPAEFLLTLTHSLGEQDETSHTLWRGHSTWNLSILGATENIIAKTRASALLSNGGLVAR